MVAQSKTIFIGFGILCFAIACQGPSTPQPAKDRALTVTSVVQTLTALAPPATAVANPTMAPTVATIAPTTAIVPIDTAALPTDTPTQVVQTPTSAMVITIVDSSGGPADTNPPQSSQPQPQPQPPQATQPSAPQVGSITGFVFYKENNYATAAPVENMNVIVIIGSTSITQQANKDTGEYRFDGLPVGPISIQFRYKSSFPQNFFKITVRAGQTAPVPTAIVVNPVPFITRIPTWTPTPTPTRKPRPTLCSPLRPCSFPTLLNPGP
jgi:hypothetical protein